MRLVGHGLPEKMTATVGRNGGKPGRHKAGRDRDNRRLSPGRS
ncbi:hypothetical protein XHC_1611 [Xanthomonas hortorum pv. carotae str. M081]|nr:hypothetical protein XHC_1611 [Xanthomonas hortorum pv. carotae str. M081]